MGKAKIASASKGGSIPKNDYKDYIRFGYKLKNGLVVTYTGGQLGIGESDANGDPIVMKHSFIDMVPIKLQEAVEFTHLTDVMVFALMEIKDKEDRHNKYMDEVDAAIEADELRQAAEYDAANDPYPQGGPDYEPRNMSGAAILGLVDALVGPGTVSKVITAACEDGDVDTVVTELCLEMARREETVEDIIKREDAKDDQIVGPLGPIDTECCTCETCEGDGTDPDSQYEAERALNNKLMEEQIAHEKATGVVDADGNYLPDAGDKEA